MDDLETILDQLDDETREKLVQSIDKTGETGGKIVFYTPELEEDVDNNVKSREEMNYSNVDDSFVAFIDEYVCPKCFCYLLLVPRSKKSDIFHSKCIACGWCNVKEERR